MKQSTNIGFILVGSGEWRGSGVMVMTKTGRVYFGVRRGRAVTAFPTKRDAVLALRRTNEKRAGIEPVTAETVRLIQPPRVAK